MYQYAARHSYAAKNRLLDPEFCLEMATFYVTERAYIRAIELYQKVVDIKHLAETKHNIALTSANALNHLASHPQDVNLCLYFAAEYFQIGRSDIAQRLIQSAGQQDPSIYKQEFCCELAIDLLRQGKFTEAHAIFSAIPTDATTYQEATNFLKWKGNQTFDITPNITVTQPLLSRQEEIQYLIGLYKAADHENHSEAHKIVQQLQQELNGILDPTKPKWAPTHFNQHLNKLPTALQEDIKTIVSSYRPN